MFVPEGYVSLRGAVECVARMREPEAVANLTPDGFTFFASVAAALRPRLAPPGAPIRSIRAGPSPGPVRDLRPADPMPVVVAEPSPVAEAQLREWNEAWRKLAAAQNKARADLRQALISGTVHAVAIREDGNLVSMPPARWRMRFARPQVAGLEPFAEALGGNTVPVTATASGIPSAWGRPIIARAELARWCGGPPEEEPAERPADWEAPVISLPTVIHGQSAVISSISKERRMAKWLADAMSAEPANPVPKSEMRTRAEINDNLSVSERAFERAWSEAVRTTRAVAWATPGRRKSPRK